MKNTFKYLTIISQPYLKISGKKNISFVKCRCICGTEKEYRLSSLKTGNTKSCGCLRKENSKKLLTIHGLKYHPLYKIWENIKTRCYNKNNKDYHYYGAKGIIVYEEWKNNPKNFYNDNINSWKPGLEIDRIDNNKNYEPGNIRWSTRKEQNNNKRNNVLMSAFGEIKNITQWSEDERCKVKYRTLVNRIRLGWDMEKALTEKLHINQFK